MITTDIPFLYVGVLLTEDGKKNKSNGTGILIGGKYVLTDAHLVLKYVIAGSE